LEIKRIEVDSTHVFGITSLLEGYLSGTLDNYNCYENSCWSSKNNTNPANRKDEFSTCIPLECWLSLFENFKKIFMNYCRLELILTRSHSDLNVLNEKCAGSAIITIDRKVEVIEIDRKYKDFVYTF